MTSESTQPMPIMHRLIFAILIFGSLFYLGSHPVPEERFAKGSDEGYYFLYADRLKENGMGELKTMVEWYSSSEEARRHPAPVRLLHFAQTATAFKIFGSSYTVLGCLSMLAFLLFLIVNYLYIKKFFGLETALPVVAILASSPLLMGLSRRALMDMNVCLIWTLMLWFFFDWLAHQRKAMYWASVVAVTAALLTKESSIFLIPFLAVFGSLFKYVYKGAVRRREIVGLVMIPIVLANLVFIAALGFEHYVLIVKAILKTHFESNHPNPYATDYSAGPWFRYLVDFTLLSPLTVILFMFFLGVFFDRYRADWRMSYFVCYFFVVYAMFNLLPHSKVVRFVANLEVAMTVGAVFFLQRIAGRSRLKNLWLVFLVCIIVSHNFDSFQTIFQEMLLLDPITFHLMRIRGFMPFNPCPS